MNTILAQAVTDQFKPSSPVMKFGTGSGHRMLWILAFLTAFIVAGVVWEYYREWKIRRFYQNKQWKPKRP
ncbi:MAG TPA: hypothetical protein VG146_10405 [Verrucomicrobiae bacterium]|nr:hypothetical protein [Verrucomicrobiae bacterium]